MVLDDSINDVDVVVGSHIGMCVCVDYRKAGSRMNNVQSGLFSVSGGGSVPNHAFYTAGGNRNT